MLPRPLRSRLADANFSVVSGAQRNQQPKPSVETSLAALSRQDHGVFTYAEAVSFNISKYQLRRRVAGGVLERPYPGVYMVRSNPSSWMQRAIAVLKWVGPEGALSHRSAARLWHLVAVPEDAPIEVSCPRDLRRRANAETHTVAPWKANDVCLLNRVRVTTPIRTILDLAGQLDAAELRGVLEDALIRGLIDLERLKRRIDAADRRGRKGIGRVAAEIAAIEQTPFLPRSELERRFLRACEKASMPHPVLQLPIETGERKYFIDFAYPEHKLAVEMDGWRFHGSRSHWESDIRRSNDLVALGWRVIRGTWRDIQEDPAAFVERIRSLLQPELPDSAAVRN